MTLHIKTSQVARPWSSQTMFYIPVHRKLCSAGLGIWTVGHIRGNDPKLTLSQEIGGWFNRSKEYDIEARDSQSSIRLFHDASG